MAEDMDVDLSELADAGGSTLKTQLPGVTVETSLEDADPEDLEAVHRRQLEWALEHAEEAKEATRM